MIGLVWQSGYGELLVLIIGLVVCIQGVKRNDSEKE